MNGTSELRESAYDQCAGWIGAKLHRARNVQEEAAVVVAQIGQIVGEIREVVADADLEVIA